VVIGRLLGLEDSVMMSRDTLCDLCERVVPGEEVATQHCEGCGAVICDEHSSEPYGPHDPEDHISPDDAEDVEERPDE
jgi:hypothetical protein